MENFAEYLLPFQSQNNRESSESSLTNHTYVSNNGQLLSALNMPWDRVQQLLQNSDSLLTQNGNDSSEISYLNDCPNCQRKIKSLENKISEIQNQLSAAVASNYTKNTMIDQLDKMLARVVEGWKKYEAEKTNKIMEAEKERAAMASTLKKEQEILKKLELELNKALEKLMLSEQEIRQTQQEKIQWIENHETELIQLRCDLESKKVSLDKLSSQLITNAQEYEMKRSILQEEFDQEIEIKNERQKTLEAAIESLKKQISNEELKNSALQKELSKTQEQLGVLTSEKQSLELQLENKISAVKEAMEKEKNLALKTQKQEYELILQETKDQLHAKYNEMLTNVKNLQETTLERLLKEKEDWALKEIGMIEMKCTTLLEEMDKEHQHQLEEVTSNAEQQQHNLKERLEEFEKFSFQLHEESSTLANVRSSMMSRIQSLLQAQWHEVLNILYGKEEIADKENNLNFTHNHGNHYSFQRCCDHIKRNDLDYIPCSDSKAGMKTETMCHYSSSMTENPCKSCNRTIVGDLVVNKMANVNSDLKFSHSIGEEPLRLSQKIRTCSSACENTEFEAMSLKKHDNRCSGEAHTTLIHNHQGNCPVSSEHCQEPQKNCQKTLPKMSERHFDMWLNSLYEKRHSVDPSSSLTNKFHPQDVPTKDMLSSKSLAGESMFPPFFKCTDINSYQDNNNNKTEFRHLESRHDEINNNLEKICKSDNFVSGSNDSIRKSLPSNTVTESPAVSMATYLSSDHWSPESCGSTESQFKRFTEASAKRTLAQEARQSQLKAYLEKLLQSHPGEFREKQANSEIGKSN